MFALKTYKKTKNKWILKLKYHWWAQYETCLWRNVTQVLLIPAVDFYFA